MRAYQEVLARIEQDLLTGRTDVGGRLPPERELAPQYQVSRASVREAIRVLDAMGVIRTRAGSGPDAGAVVSADPSAPICAALRWHLASRHLPVADLVSSRVVITAIMQAMRYGIRAYVTEAVRSPTDWPSMAARLRTEHGNVLTAVPEGDGLWASRAVSDHINGFYAETGLS